MEFERFIRTLFRNTGTYLYFGDNTISIDADLTLSEIEIVKKNYQLLLQEMK